MGSLKKEESILIHNAGGGVGLAALDIAKKIGAKTYGTASSTKHVFLLNRGLDHAIDYRTQDWFQARRRPPGHHSMGGPSRFWLSKFIVSSLEPGLRQAL